MAELQLDGNKMLHHLDRVNSWSKGDLIAPIYIAVSPTSYCNHKCVFCVYHYKEFKPIFFPEKRFAELCEEWSQLGVKSLFFAGDGDPLINKACAQMVRAAKTNQLDVALNTNGPLLTEKSIDTLVEDLSFIRVSCNAGTAETYAHLHGTKPEDFEIVLNNLSNLVATKKQRNSKIVIGVQCLLLSKNIHEIKGLALRLREVGVDYFSIKPFLKHPEIVFNDTIENLDVVLETLGEVQKEVSTDNFKFVLRRTLFGASEKRSYKSCLSTPFMIEMDALGDIYSCGPHIGTEEHKLGNVLSTSFAEMWKSEKAEKSRNFVKNCVNVSSCMPFCRPNSVNEFLWQIKNPPQHVNYI